MFALNVYTSLQMCTTCTYSPDATRQCANHFMLNLSFEIEQSFLRSVMNGSHWSVSVALDLLLASFYLLYINTYTRARTHTRAGSELIFIAIENQFYQDMTESPVNFNP